MIGTDKYNDTNITHSECGTHPITLIATKSPDRKSCFIWSFLIFSLLSLISEISTGEENQGNILILLSDNGDVYLDVATTITNSTIKSCRDKGLSCKNSNFDIVQVSSYDKQQHKNYRLVITLGTQAALFSQKHITDTTTFSALIPKDNKLIEKSSNDKPQHHYLYLNQPIERSLLLIKVLSDRFKIIGSLINIKDKFLASELDKSAKKLGLSLILEAVDPSQNIGNSLNILLGNIDIFLALPDTDIHNNSTVSNILLSAYRKRIPLIGFSSAYVRAGALAAIYSSPKDIAYQVRDNIVTFFSLNPTPKRQQMEEYFSVMFNKDVARSLDFPIKSETKLKEMILDRLRYDSE
jgi:putative tryptophan/tyrosine transport system substrate-binding protein